MYAHVENGSVDYMDVLSLYCINRYEIKLRILRSN